MKVIVIGAGIGGLCAALALQQQGVQVVVYEMAGKLKAVGAGIGLAANAIRGLQRLGVAEAVIQKGKRLTALQMLDGKGRLISNQDTTLLKQEYGEVNLVIHRAALQEILLQQLPEGTVCLGKRCIRLEQEEGTVKVFFADGSSDEADLVVAADGIHSFVRQLLLPESKPRYAGYTCWRAVINDIGFDYNPMISAETWAPQGRFGMAALPGNSIYWYCCLNAPEKDERMRRMTPKDLAQHFEGVHAPIAEVLATTKAEQLIRSDIQDIKPLDHLVFGRVVLLGDAAHATTPNMGQGACQAIEDAVVLADVFIKHKDMTMALQQYEKRRIKRVAKVIRLSRLLGKVAQWQHPWLCSFRNGMLRALPKSYIKRQMRWLFEVDL